MFNLFKKKNNESWESIKASGKAFPKIRISILSFTGEDDEGGIEILFYIEDIDIINNKLEELYASDDLLVDFGCSLRTDANWETIEDMMEKYSI